MLTVHHLENSRSQRILWLLEELGLAYDVVHYKRHAKTKLAPASLKKIHPLGKSPVLTDDGSTIAESGAIIEYLVERYGTQNTLKPAVGTDARLQYTYWLHFAEGSIMPALVMQLVFGRLSKPPVPFFVRPLGKAFARAVHAQYLGPLIRGHVEWMEKALGEHTWFAGETFSAADIQMSFPLEALQQSDALGDYPNMKRFVDQIHQRPAYKKAIEKGGELHLGI